MCSTTLFLCATRHLSESFEVQRCRSAGLTLNALRAWTFVRQRARAGALTVEDVTAVRLYFERLPLRPNALFEPPELQR